MNDSDPVCPSLKRLVSDEVLHVLSSQPAWPPASWLEPAETRAARLPAQVLQQICQGARECLAAQPGWEASSLRSYRRFVEDGDRCEWEAWTRRMNGRIFQLAQCAIFAPDEGVIVELIDGLWQRLEMTSWCAPAHLGRPADGRGVPAPEFPVIDLFGGETAATLSTLACLLRRQLDAVSPEIYRRIKRECTVRILEPFAEDDSYWWMGLGDHGQRINNWNPWIVSNVLWCAFGLDVASDLRQRVVSKALRVLDRFIEDTPCDGGCDEGAGYWTHAAASFLDCIETLNTASGDRLGHLFSVDRYHQMGRYPIATCCGDRWWVNFADAPARLDLAPHLVWRFGRLFGDTELKDLALSLRAEQESLQPDGSTKPITLYSLPRRLFELLDTEYSQANESCVQLPGFIQFPVTEIATWRGRGNTGDWLISAKGGHNDESHNHNDIGNVIVFRATNPLLIDVGVGTYRRETFRADTRYSIWTMCSPWHNLPVVNGKEQPPGRAFCASDFAAEPDRVTVDLETAYPNEAGLSLFRRELLIHPNNVCKWTDTFEFNSGSNSVEWFLMTAAMPEKVSANILRLRPRALPGGRQSAGGELHFDLRDPDLTWEEVALSDERLAAVWGESIFRIRLFIESPERRIRVGLTLC